MPSGKGSESSIQVTVVGGNAVEVQVSVKLMSVMEEGEEAVTTFSSGGEFSTGGAGIWSRKEATQ